MKQKFKAFFDSNKYILISGGAALFIILLVYFCFGIIPFGDKTVYRMDLYHQYGPLFSELYDRITSGGSLVYSWNSGLGSSFLGNFYNYMSSPVSIIILLFGHKNTFEAIAAMIAIKAVLSAMSMSYYLKKSQDENSLAISAFGILYAFCGFFIAYYWNIMWIDALYLLPLIVLGIEKIINKGKPGLYLVSLTIAIFSNYYIGFMLCIFSCLYFVYYYFCSLEKILLKKKALDNSGFKNKIKNSFFLNSAVKFALASFSAGIILIFMLIPLANILSSSSATGGGSPAEYKMYFNIFDFLVNHLASLEPTIRSSGESVLPNIYCGMLTVMLIPLFMLSKKIPIGEKIASVVFLVFMYFSFNINYLNFAWHGFHFPNDLPYRQSFMYSFLLVTMAYKAFKNIGEFDKKYVFAVAGGIIVFIITAQKVMSKNLTDSTVYISLAFVLLYTVLLALMTSKKAQAFALTVMVVCSVTAEMITASTDHYVANQTKESFAGDYDDFKDIQEKVDSADSGLFYRAELSHLRARMDPSWYGYNGASIFSSMAYEKTANLQKYIGMYGNLINSFTYNPQTPIYNSMFSLKYIYDKSSYISECDYYTLTATNGRFSAYKNNYMLNIAYPVSDALSEWDAYSYGNPVTAQNEYFKLATGTDNVIDRIYDYQITYTNVLAADEDSKTNETFSFNKIDSGDAVVTMEISPKNEENVYIYINSRNLDTVNIYSQRIITSMDVSDGYILDLGKHKAGDTITVSLPLKSSVNSASVDFTAFTIDRDKFEEGYNRLREGQLEYTKFTDTIIKGNFRADSGEILYTSIPYDKSWNIYIDGKLVPNENIIKISDALIGVKVTEGNHKITFLYETQSMKGAAVISVLYTAFLIIIYILKSRKALFFKGSKPNVWQRASLSANKPISENTSDNNIK